ncbi:MULTISPECIES: AI-2E family transporter [Paenibacillus]|uniref:Sporulation integral membrane protein YtvI n=1 Tax=Paenibacillus pabuli TaxID=1472 RepID=A0A855XQ30_9BACL|nr:MULTISPECIES: AI-2E family transporter [Paenibacillus]PWW34032.1 sporulation integral membrane protein YtvI [Paenibacillus pabuli]PXW00545.1 sporulation integral membrane protein YtvI [Paenibacillus taichungensis]RAJ02865.1 sporulation integral membrane protein YtvI [Paenibacillus pabuli]
MLPLYKKYGRTVFDIALLVLTVYFIMYGFSRLYQLAAPVFLSFIVYWMIEPLARFLHRKGLPKTLGAAISVLLFLGVIVAAFFGLGLIIVSQISNLQDNFPYYIEMVQREFTNLVYFIQDKSDALPDGITEKVNDYFATLTGFLSKWVTSGAQIVIGFLSSFSSFITNFGIAIILAFFLSIEIESWRKFARAKTPKTLKLALEFMRNHVFKTIRSYLKAQMIMMLITFVLIYAGLLILGTANAFTIAAICAVFDLVPLLGVPVIFIPWIVYLFIVGNSSLAIGLIVVLAVTMLTRQLLEPKISGNSIGVSSAYLMLSFMLISLSVFGLAGVVLSPVLLILLKELLQQGYLQQWIHLPKDEFESSPLVMDTPGGAAPGMNAEPSVQEPAPHGNHEDSAK